MDDPIKNAQEAASATLRAAQRDWYASTFYTRAEPDAAIIIIQTRWHQEDLAGWLLAEESQDDQPEGWHIVNLPAIYEEPRPTFPPACTVEPDWRTVGDALCPPRFPAPRLAQIRQRLGSYFWAALYQQQPRPADGNFFKRDWFPIVAAPPASNNRLRYWDLAATDGAGDYTVGLLLAHADDRTYTIEDVVRGQWSPGARNKIICQTAALDGTEVKIVIEQEPGSSGVAARDALIKDLAGYPVRGERATGSKTVRAAPLAAQAEAGNVRLLRGAWNKAFIEELCAFPTAPNDDQADAAAGAFNAIAKPHQLRLL